MSELPSTSRIDDEDAQYEARVAELREKLRELGLDEHLDKLADFINGLDSKELRDEATIVVGNELNTKISDTSYGIEVSGPHAG